MIIDLQFTTPAWRAVIPTTHLTFTALQKTLGFTLPPAILTPGSWLREGKLLREWPRQEAEERRVRTDWAPGSPARWLPEKVMCQVLPCEWTLGPIMPPSGVLLAGAH